MQKWKYTFTHICFANVCFYRKFDTRTHRTSDTHTEISSHFFNIHRDTFTQIMFLHAANFYTQKTLPRGIRTHTQTRRIVCKQRFLHTNFEFKTFYTQVLSHTKTFGHPCLYTHRLWRVDAFAHTCLYTHTHTRMHIHKSIAHRNFCAQ